MWTQFWDMHSGGGLKEKWHYIYIEATKEEAKVIFYNRFGHNPERVTCTCCGPDYSISEEKNLSRLTAYHRNCKFVKNKKQKGGGHYIEKQDEKKLKRNASYETPEQYSKREDVLIIPASKIKKTERTGEVPQEGYVWV